MISQLCSGKYKFKTHTEIEPKRKKSRCGHWKYFKTSLSITIRTEKCSVSIKLEFLLTLEVFNLESVIPTPVEKQTNKQDKNENQTTTTTKTTKPCSDIREWSNNMSYLNSTEASGWQQALQDLTGRNFKPYTIVSIWGHKPEQSLIT